MSRESCCKQDNEGLRVADLGRSSAAPVQRRARGSALRGAESVLVGGDEAVAIALQGQIDGQGYFAAGRMTGLGGRRDGAKTRGKNAGRDAGATGRGSWLRWAELLGGVVRSYSCCFPKGDEACSFWKPKGRSCV